MRLTTKRLIGPSPPRFAAYSVGHDSPEKKLETHKDACHGGEADPACNACRELEAKCKPR
jgi:hypothetical protein